MVTHRHLTLALIDERIGDGKVRDVELNPSQYRDHQVFGGSLQEHVIVKRICVTAGLLAVRLNDLKGIVLVEEKFGFTVVHNMPFEPIARSSRLLSAKP